MKVSAFRMMAVAVLVVAVVLVERVAGFPTGAPTSACTSMTPGHSTEQTWSSPYFFEMSGVDTYTPGGTVEVKISGWPYQGFMLQARDASDNIVGTWSNLPDNTQLLDCVTSGSAVTHSSTEQKYLVTYTWNAPASSVGDVRFVGTFAWDQFVWWTGVTTTYLASVGGSDGGDGGDGSETEATLCTTDADVTVTVPTTTEGPTVPTPVIAESTAVPVLPSSTNVPVASTTTSSTTTSTTTQPPVIEGCSRTPQFPVVDQNYVLNTINGLRAADGAAAMLWDNGLATKAEDFTYTCRWASTYAVDCTGSPAGALGHYLGQVNNVINPNLNVDVSDWLVTDTGIQQAFDFWFTQSRDAYNSLGDSDTIGRTYAILMSDSSTRIGCALATSQCSAAWFYCIVNNYVDY